MPLESSHLYEPLVTGVVSAVVFGWLANSIKFQASADGSKRTLRYNKAYLATGWAGFLFCAACEIAMCYSQSPSATWQVRAGFAAFGLLGVFMIASYLRCALTYDDNGACYHPVWGQPVTFGWKDVTNVDFATLEECWRLQLQNGRKVKVGIMMNGAVEFMQALSRRGGVAVPCVIFRNGRRADFY